MQFRQVSKKQQEIADAVGVTQKTVDNRLESLVNLDRCPKLLKIAARARRRLVGFRQVSKINQDRRTREEAMIKSYTDLDKCPKPYKIAALFEEAIIRFGQVSETDKDRRTYTREEAIFVQIWTSVQK